MKRHSDHERFSELGISMLEMLVSLAIVILVIVAGYPTFQAWLARSNFESTYKELLHQIHYLRGEAQIQSTSTRLLLTRSSDTYTLTGYVADAPTSLCAAGANWSQLFTMDLSVPTKFEINGSGVGNVCFFRDGSATAGEYIIEQKDDGTDIGRATLTVTIATGFVDVTLE